MAVFVIRVTIQRSPQKSCLGNLYKFRGKRLCHMQILVTVKETKVSIENGRGGILIKLSANFQRIER